MSSRHTLLVEIGTEELPPTALRQLSESFAAAVAARLRAAEFEFSAVEPFATPRRLAVTVAALAAEQPDRNETRRGPALTAAFDAAGEPTAAAKGFARSCGVEVAALTRLASGEGEWLAFERRIAGRPLAAILPGLVGEALAELPIPKRMRWGAGTVEFVRPVHWVVMLHGSTLIEGEILGVRSGRSTRGHRFHHPEAIELAHADDYASRLERPGHVIASFAARQARVREQAMRCAEALGGRAVVEPALLDEVTALVEWPVAIGGSFDARFLELPPEVLIATMQGHQKYFPVTDDGGRLRASFITIANIDSRDPAAVRAGNERVIRPRLSDADFFFRKDRASSLESRLPGLDDVSFEKRLGSLGDKTRRVATLARRLATSCGAEPELAARAAVLSRCDLLTDMVGEFPELQGSMGSHYAAADGEPEAVCAALADFYRPRFAGDDIPAGPTGRTIALADKIDSLVGIFGIGSAPSGDKDPFALRRAAIGIVRIVLEGGIDLDVHEAIAASVDTYAGVDLLPDTALQVQAFIRERMRGYHLERGVPAAVCEAVFAKHTAVPAEVARRLDAVERFRALPAARALAAANKRIANILKKLDAAPPGEVVPELLVEPPERALAERYVEVAATAGQLFEAGDYARYMELLASLREPVDAFFDGVMVMTEDGRLRSNRLALLGRLHHLFTRVADIGMLHDS